MSANEITPQPTDWVLKPMDDSSAELVVDGGGEKLKPEEVENKFVPATEVPISDVGVMDQQSLDLVRQQEALKLMGLESMGGDRGEYAGSSELYKREAQNVLRLVRLDPLGFVRQHVVGVINAGSARPDLLMESRYAGASPVLSHDQGRVLETIQKAMSWMGGIKASGDLEGGARVVGYVTPGEIMSLHSFNVPLRVEISQLYDAATEKRDVELGFVDAMDLINSSAAFRFAMLAKDQRVRDSWEIEAPGILLNRVFNRTHGFDLEPNRYVGVEYADIDERRAILSNKETRQKLGLKGISPDKIDEQVMIQDPSGLPLIDYGDFKTWAGWTLKPTEALYFAFGRVAHFWPETMNSRFAYPERSSLRGDRYAEALGIHMFAWRASADTLYRDLWSENWSKLSPWEGLSSLDKDTLVHDNKVYDLLGLGSVDLNKEMWGDVENDKAAKEAKNLFEFMTTDAPLLTWLKPYEELIYNGETIIFDAKTPINIPKLDGLRIEELSSTPDGYAGKCVRVDFSDTRTARQFIFANRSVKGWTRTKDEMWDVAQGFTDAEKQTFNNRDFTRVSKFMKFVRTKDSTVFGDNTKVGGYEGLLQTVKMYSEAHHLYQNISEYDLWKWWYYKQVAGATYGTLGQVFGASCIAAISDHPSEESVAVIHKQEEELIASAKELSKPKYMNQAMRNEVAMTVLVGLANNCGSPSEHKFYRSVRYETKTVDGSPMLIPSTNKTLNERQKTLGFRVHGYGKNAALIGFGGHMVYKSKKIENREFANEGGTKILDFPARMQFGSRSVSLHILDRLLNESFLDTGMVSKGSKAEEFVHSAREHKLLPNDIFMTPEERNKENLKYVRI